MPKRGDTTLDRSRFVAASAIHKRYDINEKTLRRWAKDGKLRHVRYNGVGGKRLYELAHLKELLGDHYEEEEAVHRTQRIVYARVSSAHQRPDLARQSQELQEAYPTHELITDVGSGLNFKRKGLTAILERVIDGLVKEIVVLHKDRLCRFGCDLLESIFKKVGTKLVVHCKGDVIGEEDCRQELADDLLAVTTVFVARHNGLRSGANRRRRAENQKANGRDTEESSPGQSKEGSSLPNTGTAKNPCSLVRGGPMDVQPNNRVDEGAASG